jgi:hypothetical protein
MSQTKCPIWSVSCMPSYPSLQTSRINYGAKVAYLWCCSASHLHTAALTRLRDGSPLSCVPRFITSASRRYWNQNQWYVHYRSALYSLSLTFQVRIYLDHLHMLLLSVLSSTQLERILTKHTNFDLRRLLTGTTTLLHSHLARLPTSPGILTSSLQTMRLDPAIRTRVAEALVPPSKLKTKDALYALLVVDDKVVTIARPRKHSIHPTDLHVLLATIAAPSIKGTTASWLPICLPKFNASGFLHAYVSFIRSEGDTPGEHTETERKPSIALILISASGDFDSVRAWSGYTIDQLESSSTIDALLEAVRTAEYTLDDLQIPGLRHFIYKSRVNVQVTMPHYDFVNGGSESEFQRIFSLYRTAYDAIHAKGGQECTLRLQYVKTQSVCVMAWVRDS